MVPPASHKLTGVRGTQDASRSKLARPLPDSHRLWWCVPAPSGGHCLLVLLVLQPHTSQDAWFGLFPVRSPLLGESRLISLRRATEMFQFAHGPPPCLSIQQGVARHDSGGVAPFGFSGLIARMQLPLNVSPVSASFIGLQRQGILPVLFFACSSTLLLLSAILK